MARGAHVGDVRARPSVAERGSRIRGPGLREALAVGAIVALDLGLIVVTYARLAPDDLYNTSVGGLRGGLGRALVGANFPVSLIALAVLGVAANALLDTHRRLVATVSAVAIPLCLLTPFVVHQDDLDAAVRNVLPAIGVLLIAALTGLAVRSVGLGRTPAAQGDSLRIALAVMLGIIAVPWIVALVGFYAPDPVYADEPSPGESLAAVHLGHHHGLDGVIVGLAALALSRALPSFRHSGVTAVTSALLALGIAYGIANALQDFTLEQLWKRGTIAWKPPSVVSPSLTWGWLAILGAAAVVEIVWFRRERRPGRERSPS